MSPSIQRSISPWIARQLSHIDGLQGKGLDLACGSGRHARFLHELGFQVVAADRDPTAFVELAALGIGCVQCDFEASPNGFSWPFRRECFSVILVTNYLHRPLFPSILSSLAVNGVLLYETFAQGNEFYGRPRNPDFLLRSNELLQRCLFEVPLGFQFECLAYEHGLVNRNEAAIVQSICVRRIS